MIDEEIWRPVSGFSRYEVSNMGRVRRLNRHKRVAPFRILKPSTYSKYAIVSLTSTDKPKHVKFAKVHRLVAFAFLGEPLPGHEVNHKDGNKLNNVVNNLEWVTKSENEKHAYRVCNKPIKFMVMKGEHNPRAILTIQDVIEIRASNLSQPVLAKMYGVGRTQISNIKLNRCWNEANETTIVCLPARATTDTR